jgi:hypothetical protein
VVPRQWKVIQTVREKFTCRACERITQPPAPFHAIARGRAGPGLLAQVLHAKFALHQPLNRQSDTYTREGVALDVSTLADWVGACTATLRPLTELIRRHVLAAERLHGDDTTVPVLAKQRTVTGRLWTGACPSAFDRSRGSATTGPSAAPARRQRCSSTPATAAASMRAGTSPVGAVSCRPTPTLGSVRSTNSGDGRHRSPKPPAGATDGASSSCSPI